MYKKLMLDEMKVKLVLRYMPMVVGCEAELTICDDEDLFVYLTSIDKDNRRSLLLVEETSRSEQLEKLSRVGISSFGMNYEVLQGNDDAIGPNAITLYVENGEANQQKELIEAENDDDTTQDDFMDTDNAVGTGTATETNTADETDTAAKTVETNTAAETDTADETETAAEAETGADMEIVLGDKYAEQSGVEKSSQVIEEWDDGLSLFKLQEFRNKKTIQEVVDRAAFGKSFRYVIKKSDRRRFVVKCCEASCKWGLRAAMIPQTELFSVRRYTGVHTCSRTIQSKSCNIKRRGSAELVATFLNEEYPGKLRTPVPRDIMDLMKLKLGVTISYSTALRGKNLAICELRGNSEDSYKMLYSYLYMLEEVNPGTRTRVKLDEASKFKYLFIALGACIEGFAVMRKVIIVDATFLKNGYGGVLVFAKAQDPNRHHYPLAISVLDGENTASWTWFFEMLKTVISDSSELVFMSDRNQSLIAAVAKVFPQSQHGHCIWHLAQNVRNHACNTTKAVVAWRFMELARYYTVAEFESAYASFKVRYPSAYKYVEEHTQRDTWARVYFPGDRYNLDTSNCVESMNSTFRDARGYALIPMLDTIIQKISDWFNKHRKDAVAGSIDTKLVPLVENHLHNIWGKAEKTPVRELNSYELEYEVTDIDDGKNYVVNLVRKSCTCKVYDYEKYPCLHGLAAYLYFLEIDAAHGRRREVKIEYHELCSKYYWTELWALAYYKTIYSVPDKSDWNVPDHIKELRIIPPDRLQRKGRKKNKRNPSVGE